MKVTISEPGAYATEFGSQSSLRFAAASTSKQILKTQLFERISSLERGDPDAMPVSNAAQGKSK
jgi:hypothetical protein